MFESVPWLSGWWQGEMTGTCKRPGGLQDSLPTVSCQMPTYRQQGYYSIRGLISRGGDSSGAGNQLVNCGDHNK